MVGAVRRDGKRQRMTLGNIDANIDAPTSGEIFTDLLHAKTVRIERIVSTGQATAPGQWLEQDRGEWVILLRGSASLRFEGDAQAQTMKPGDYLDIPAHRRHRVDWTAADAPTVWLAVHYDP
jgi:cupin 2 domain-containing protein